MHVSIGITRKTHTSMIINKQVGMDIITGFGGGMCSWYLFRSQNGKLYFIIKSYSNESFNWKWREIDDDLDEIPLEIYESI